MEMGEVVRWWNSGRAVNNDGDDIWGRVLDSAFSSNGVPYLSQHPFGVFGGLRPKQEEQITLVDFQIQAAFPSLSRTEMENILKVPYAKRLQHLHTRQHFFPIARRIGNEGERVIPDDFSNRLRRQGFSCRINLDFEFDGSDRYGFLCNPHATYDRADRNSLGQGHAKLNGFRPLIPHQTLRGLIDDKARRRQ